MAAFCVLSLVFLVYRDLAIPEVRDTEVWLGFELHGAAALLTAPLHWAIFAAGAWAHWTQQRWIARATAYYILYVAISHLIWWQTAEASAAGALRLRAHPVTQSR